MTQQTTFNVTATDLQKILDYMGTRPYNEVHHLVTLILAQKPILPPADESPISE